MPDRYYFVVLLYRLRWWLTRQPKCDCCGWRHPTTGHAYWRGNVALCAPCDYGVHDYCECSKVGV